MANNQKKYNKEFLENFKKTLASIDAQFFSPDLLEEIGKLCVNNIRTELSDFIAKRGGVSSESDLKRLLDSIIYIIAEREVLFYVQFPEDLIEEATQKDPEGDEGSKENQDADKKKQKEQSKMRKLYEREKIRLSRLEAIKKTASARARARARAISEKMEKPLNKKQISEYIDKQVALAVKKFNTSNKPLMTEQARLMFIKESEGDGKKKIAFKAAPIKTEDSWVHHAIADRTYLDSGLEKSLPGVQKLIDMRAASILK